MLVGIDQFIRRHQDLIGQYDEAIGDCHHIEVELQNHHFPRQVEVQKNDKRQYLEQKIVQLTQKIKIALAGEGQSAEEVEQAFRIISSRVADKHEKNESHKSRLNGGKEKWLWVVGGPNGAGKSTFVASEYGVLAGHIPLVNPDDIAAELCPEDINRYEKEAGRIAIDRINQYRSDGRSFIIESTLSGNYHKKLIQTLKAEGWKIGLVYITNNSPETSIERVKIRVATGGHNVPEEDIRRRWQRSLEKLPSHLSGADQIYIIDNSTRSGFQLVASGVDGKVCYFRKELLPGVKKTLEEHGRLITMVDLTKAHATPQNMNQLLTGENSPRGMSIQ